MKFFLLSLLLEGFFLPLAETPHSKWNEVIPTQKRVPTLEEVYAHRSPWETGIVYADGKSVSLMQSPTGTITHELIHGINAYLRSQKQNQAAFYIPKEGYVAIQETKAKRTLLPSLIPQELRGIDGKGGRFHQYIETPSGKEPDAGTYFDPSSGKKLWGETTVFYIWDEWNAYVYGGITDLEAEKAFGKNYWDSLTGPVEFMIYALAGLMAIQKQDPDYVKTESYQQAKILYEFLAQETMNLLEAGRESSLEPQKARRYLEVFMNSPSQQAQMLRQFIVENFGKSWSQEVLGFRD